MFLTIRLRQQTAVVVRLPSGWPDQLSERGTMGKPFEATGRLAAKLAVLSLFGVGVGVLGLTVTTSTPTVTAAQKFQIKMPLSIDAEIWESLIPKNNLTGPSVRSRRSQ